MVAGSSGGVKQKTEVNSVLGGGARNDKGLVGFQLGNIVESNCASSNDELLRKCEPKASRKIDFAICVEVERIAGLKDRTGGIVERDGSHIVILAEA
jgi:hypothetical protein